ncbi:MAG: Na/Pi cotransporter family protein, partial [Clostridia bacterium]|nr:Na/Pi cotransporter family protein [Clostridia bacterium]
LSAKISDYLVKVSASGISLSDERTVNTLHNNVGDMARIAELADNFTKYTRREVRDNLRFSDGIMEKVQNMYELVKEQYGLVKKIILEGDRSLIEQSDGVEEKIDATRKELVAEHIVRLSQGKCRPENNTVFVNMVCNLERIGDHLSFIAHSRDYI